MRVKSKHLYTEENKRAWWGEGEWVTEPDYVEFEHLGYKCEIIRIKRRDGKIGEHVFGGHLCAYVTIPEGHPYHGRDTGDKCFEDERIQQEITYARYSNTDDAFKVGIDFGHDGLLPSMVMLSKMLQVKGMDASFPNLISECYRTIAYAIDEAKKLAKVVKEFEDG